MDEDKNALEEDEEMLSDPNDSDEANTDSDMEQDEDSDESGNESHTDSDTEQKSETSFLRLLQYMFQENELEGDIEADMEKFYEKFENILLIQNLLPKLKLYKEFMKEFRKKLKTLKKNDDDDGIAENANSYESDAFLETFRQFEDRFERNMQHFYETLSIDEEELDIESGNERENEQEPEKM